MQDYIDNYVSENYIKKDRKSAKEINGIEQHYDFIV